jgi:hypothetical protein
MVGRPHGQSHQLVEDVWKFVEANGDQLDAAIDYSRDLGYDYFGALDDLGYDYGRDTKNDGKSQLLMGKLTINGDFP